ncbi:MAG: hypothetical protein SGI92_33995 [Bryobacteraceae bacterium]|nr:hypothetical protein [Bryobacteraceae bacterium]
MSHIERAVAEWLKLAHPDIHTELIWRACKMGGLVDLDEDLHPNSDPAPDPPEPTR